MSGGAGLPDPHAASLLGRELEPPIVMPRPRFRFYPGPVVCGVAFLLLAALAAFGLLTFRATLSPGFYQLIAGCAVLMLVLCILSTWWWLRLGVTMSLRELGVVLITHKRQYSILYADIDAVTIADSRRYDERRAVVAFNRTVTVEANGRKTRATYVALPNDALDPLLDRLAARVAAEPRPRSGDGWTVDLATLRWRGSDVPLHAIGKTGVFDGAVRLWLRGEDMHFASVPLSSRNAHVFLHLAQRGAAASPPVASPSSSTKGLGRLLFTRRTSATSVVFNTIIAFSVLWLAMLSVERFLEAVPMPAARGVLLGIGVLVVLRAIYRLTMRYRFHERGLTRTSIVGNRTLLYGQIRAMTWAETTTIIEGIATGTSVVAKLVPDDGTTPLVVRIHRFRAGDPDIVPLRHTIARSIGTHLREHLERDGRVPWTKDATFTAAGLEVKTGLFGGNTTLLPYDQPIGIRFSDGFLHLFRENWKKPLAILPASGENFYPGLALFEMLMENVTVPEERTA